MIVKDLYNNKDKYVEKSVSLEGWVRNIRAQKDYGFIDLHDGSFFKSVQVVYDTTLNNFKDISKIRVGSSISVKGLFIDTPNAKQPFEIHATEVSLLGDSLEDYPIQPKRHTREFLREVAHLRPRTNLFSAVFRLRSVCAFAIHEFFQKEGFIYFNAPLITANDGEGAGEMFNVSTLNPYNLPLDDNKDIDYKKDFFGKKVGLTVSGQLEAEAYALAFRNVYTFGPTFRAENSNTQRHASEFWMIEPEMAFCDLKGDMEVAEKMVKYVISKVLNELKEEMEFFDKFVQNGLLERLNAVVNSNFIRVTHHDAITILKNSKVKFENPIDYGQDFFSEHEKYLTEVHFKAPVFVTDWPKEIKAFYMRLNDDNKTVAAVDLLVPGSGELIGGSQREERLDKLESRMLELNMKLSDFSWYLDLRKYGGCKHAGFGLGFERLLMYLSGVENIRDVIPFPRTPKNCEF
jgi:asparaginyl-tRNA synthetase